MNILKDKELAACVGGRTLGSGAVLYNFDKDPAPELIVIYTPNGIRKVTPGRLEVRAATA